ncbi:MAG: hypothetical protein HC882_04540 [Acidobacteria bacterium]|nr:hypothetical protein [Acidobacteriota bacterium]
MRDGSSWRVFSYRALAHRAPEGSALHQTIAGRGVTLVYRSSEPVVIVTDDQSGEPVPAVHALWFAWVAIHGLPPEDAWLTGFPSVN